MTRIRLWNIVLLHDRGTSLLLGRPLAIAPSDSNTPGPTRTSSHRQPDFSHYLESSNPIAHVQADIVTTLYTPYKLQGRELFQRTMEIIARLVEARKQLGDKYKHYFEGTAGWSTEERLALVESIQLDEGLTLLKLGITRLLLMRALFRLENGVPDEIRSYALRDAVITAHNIIVTHNQLIRFPDAAFFVAPSPLHIAAFVILFGHVHGCDVLKQDVEVADVWMALDMIPRFRWRWDRKDMNGGHPYIHSLAGKILDVDLSQAGPLTQPGLLLEVPDWSHVDWATAVPHPGAPVLVKAEGHGAIPQYAQVLDSAMGFYPFYPENTSRLVPPPPTDAASSWPQHAALAAYQQSHSSYMQEERDVAPAAHGAPTWMQQVRSLLLFVNLRSRAPASRIETSKPRGTTRSRRTLRSSTARSRRRRPTRRAPSRSRPRVRLTSSVTTRTRRKSGTSRRRRTLRQTGCSRCEVCFLSLTSAHERLRADSEPRRMRPDVDVCVGSLSTVLNVACRNASPWTKLLYTMQCIRCSCYLGLVLQRHRLCPGRLPGCVLAVLSCIGAYVVGRRERTANSPRQPSST
jgi:hypothetical protein